MAELKVLSSTVMKTTLDALLPQLERETGHRVQFQFGPSLQLEARLGEGEAADVAILARSGAEALAARGRLVRDSLTDLVRSSLGVVIRKGAPKPDISSADAFRRTMLAATSIGVSKPVGGGQSGAHMAKVFAQLGIADAIKDKVKYSAGGPAGLVGLMILRGEVEIGVQQIAEIMAVPGVEFAGPMPDALQSVTTFTAAIAADAADPKAGRALIDFLATPEAQRVIRAKGHEPA